MTARWCMAPTASAPSSARRIAAFSSHLVSCHGPACPAAQRHTAGQVAFPAAAATTTPNAPRGADKQGYGVVSAAQPTVFHPTRQLEAALDFFEEQRYVVIDALSQSEIAELDALADRWVDEFQAQSSAQTLFYPLLDYPEVDQFVEHPSAMGLIERILGGREHVRFQELNWRGYPRGYGALAADGTRQPGSHSMSFHPDASLPDRHTREPYGPPDYVSAFYYLTDTDERTPRFCVVPRSCRYPTLTSAREGLGEAYVEQPISGPKGTCTIVDTAVFHTRLDGDGTEPRRLMHLAYARGGWLRLADGSWRAPSPVNNPHNLFPPRLAMHPDPEVRRLYCLWSPSMCEWAAAGFQQHYRSHRPVKGSPDPALRRGEHTQS
eukprot:COSAG05_NODE_1445_length_4869_cov_17.898349_2_plen_379_part_00